MNINGALIMALIIVASDWSSLTTTSESTEGSSYQQHKPCRSREGYMNEEKFWSHSCVKCYHYKDLPDFSSSIGWTSRNDGDSDHFTFQFNSSADPQQNTSSNHNFESDLRIFEILFKNYAEKRSMKNESESGDVKISFVRNLCDRFRFGKACLAWRKCCKSAYKCCKRMKDFGNVEDDVDRGGDYCPMTWDGYDCWDSVKANSTVTRKCPTSIDMIHPEGKSVKMCNENGSWVKSRGQEWTNYRDCLKIDDHVTRIVIEMTFDAICSLLLIPSIILFLSFRDLRKQFRIKIHLNFFTSLLLSSLSSLVYHTFVHYDVIRTSFVSESVVFRNPIWCRVLTFLKIYFNSCTYSWMFCEGVYLHSLLITALHKHHSIINYIVLGWTLPLIISLSYAFLRFFHLNIECWSVAHGIYEWILFAPNIACLLLNFIFLVNIVRIIIFKLRPLPRETPNIRKGLRAAAMLVPLFGLHILMTIYRADSYAHLDVEEDDDGGDDDNNVYKPSGSRSYYLATNYNHVASAVLHSQGIFVSLLFCYLSEEVVGHIRKLWACHMRKQFKGRASQSTQNISLTSDLKMRIDNTKMTNSHRSK